MTTLRDYEVTVIVNAELEDENRKEIIEKMSGTLTHGEGDEAKPVFHDWGRRQMAYPIKKMTDGHYLFFEAQLDGRQISEIERNMNYDENILRYLFVRKEE